MNKPILKRPPVSTRVTNILYIGEDEAFYPTSRNRYIVEARAVFDPIDINIGPFHTIRNPSNKLDALVGKKVYMTVKGVFLDADLTEQIAERVTTNAWIMTGKWRELISRPEHFSGRNIIRPKKRRVDMAD